ncbi:tRNA pseudouridine38-40 synthase [Algoriphagus faecimaris]|uniref:tRNA pseudouridine synthase A n=1 Tax=Algoriphagus faecimaris TaxID=686796 RepID=A0A1G6QIW8_9BACT|nr:hypothetical protein [Algoriphagus faecimaris]SDC91854.1 tRNA pseudouridine38-40 synthase [Algoriphagus faecimaris]
MQSKPFSYLFTVSYFGARFKGWAIQKGQPTIQGKLERVFRFVLGNEDFTILGGSRTDSGVSCLEGYFQFFSKEEINWENYFDRLNQNLGGEIKLLGVIATERSFNLIAGMKSKTYRYFFSDSILHPFATAFVAEVSEGKLDFSQMNAAAQLFEGEHDFRAFCTLSESKSDYQRSIIHCLISKSDQFSGEFFSRETRMMEIKGEGFLHHQVRKIMRAIWYVGLGYWTLEEISGRLELPEKNWEKIPPAPPNGLFLWKTELQDF